MLACEFFATDNGPVFNEMAPRVHNSGHWTIEGAETSQFENHIRAICGLPLGDTTLTGTRVEMENLIGDDAWEGTLTEKGAHLHLYGKGDRGRGARWGTSPGWCAERRLFLEGKGHGHQHACLIDVIPFMTGRMRNLR